MHFVDGSGKGSPGKDRELPRLRRENPDLYMQKVRMAARMRVEGQSWVACAKTSGIGYDTLKSWNKDPNSKAGKIFKALLDEEHAKAGMTPDGKVIDKPKPYEVKTEGFATPESLAEHWSIEATRIQVETMLDYAAPRKERLEAAKRIQDLGGHSPVSKSIVVTAPLEDKRVAAALYSVLEEVKLLTKNPPPMIEHVQDAEFQESV